MDDEIIGTVGIYEIEGKRAHIGRILMYGNAIESIEAYLLTIKFGFDVLLLDELWGDTDVNNTSAIKYTKLFGFEYGEPFYDPDMDRNAMLCTLDRGMFEPAEKKVRRMIYR